MKLINFFIFSSIALLIACGSCEKDDKEKNEAPKEQISATTDNGEWFVLKKEDLVGEHHTKHFETLGKYVDGYNQYFLKGIDRVQESAPDGGGYFIGITANPPESPIGYNLAFQGQALLEAPRTTSYCSGSSYSAFIEGLNFLFEESDKKIDAEHLEALRMQEPDGGRREDGVKMWGNWNADGFGNHFALVSYAKMGEVIEPNRARPGDFMNISWKSGLGHSVIFLGWYIDEDGQKNVVYWSSQKATNGLADQIVPISKIKNVMVVRVTNPENVFNFAFDNEIDKHKGFDINW